MTRQQKLAELEQLCQQRYDIIDNCYQTICYAQKELEALEVKYLKAKAKVSEVTLTKRTSKIEKLRKTLISLGVTDVDSFLKFSK
jgi:hypothetical protein